MSALFSPRDVNEQEQKLMVQVKIQGQEVSMEVDCGASCSIVSEETFRQIEADQGEIPLRETGTTLVTWSKEALPLVHGGSSKRLDGIQGPEGKPTFVVSEE